MIKCAAQAAECSAWLVLIHWCSEVRCDAAGLTRNYYHRTCYLLSIIRRRPLRAWFEFARLVSLDATTPSSRYNIWDFRCKKGGQRSKTWSLVASTATQFGILLFKAEISTATALITGVWRKLSVHQWCGDVGCAIRCSTISNDKFCVCEVTGMRETFSRLARYKIGDL